jgi:hypothetical protein
MCRIFSTHRIDHDAMWETKNGNDFETEVYKARSYRSDNELCVDTSWVKWPMYGQRARSCKHDNKFSC